MADMKPQGTQEYSIENGYESADANPRSVVVGALIVATSVFVVMAAMFGMFNVLNNNLLEADKKVPVTLTERVIPPEPRLLPSPYTDEQGEVEAVTKRAGLDPVRTTADVFPWDKRTLEINQQYDEANATAQTPTGGVQIPIQRAMELEAGVNKGGTPAIMTWQSEYPTYIAGKSEEGMNLTPGSKNDVSSTFDERPKYWETQDEKFTSDSSGGTLLKNQRGEWSR